ncbi:hypothetical protein BDA99DRAFT_575784 [Phascolomyces articulosus]|uniref:F-box domain-containing protein n=1 Tax=Phascolomyces articulosus TaxID=60185 RepID=A0AAD5JPX9_9FUNG|nr:hypothetical protein BDA99DRAFT_575784 [Phascolomyces articulosus]
MTKKRQAQEPFGSPCKRKINNNCTNDTIKALQIQLTEAATKDLDNERSNDEIELSLAGLDRIIVNAHELRANVWARKANTTEELKSTLSMIELLPTYIVGYLRSGKLYEIQGYQERAIKIYDIGIHTVPSSDPLYRLLQENKEMALSRSQKRIDFIANCPYDIVRIILDLLPKETLLELTMVARTWRQKTVEDPIRWKTFRVIRGLHANTADRSYRLLPIVSHHVEVLKIKGSSDFVPKCLQFIRTHNFSNLQSLKVNQLRLGFSQQRINCYELFTNMLLNIANSLTSLEFKDVSIDLPPLAIILSLCRNLKIFQQHSTPVHKEWFKGLSLSYAICLTKIVLDLPHDWDEASDKEIETLLHRSPQLEHLVLDSCNVNKVLPVAIHCCQRLTNLVLNQKQAEIREEITCHNKSPGALLNVLLGGNFSASTLQFLLERKGCSIVELFLAPESSSFSNDEDWSSLSGGSTAASTMNSLVKLSILQCQPSSTISDLATIMIEKAQGTLHDVGLLDFDPGVTDGMVNALVRVVGLERLTLDGCTMGSLASRGHIFSQFCHLDFLSLCMCDGVTLTLLQSIGYIKGLKKLIVERIDDGPAYQMNEFTRLIGNLSNLIYLQISYTSLDFTDIENLCKSKTLKTIGWNAIDTPNDAVETLKKHGIKVTIL